MVECKYYSFYALAKINDPELLYEAFQQQIAPGHAGKIEVEVYQYSDQRWNRLTRSGGSDPNISETILGILAQKFGVQDTRRGLVLQLQAADQQALRAAGQDYRSR
jgi:hypothetical protein